MDKTQKDVRRITKDDPETIEEMYERIRVESMTPEQQRIYLLHKLDQFNAIPSLYERKHS